MKTSSKQEDDLINAMSGLTTPKIFSKVWWSNLAMAVKPWKFTAQQHAIWQVSSAVSWLQIFGLKAINNLILTKAPWFYPFFKGVAAKISAGFTFVYNMIMN